MKVSRNEVASGVSVFSAFFSVLPVGCCVFPAALSFLGASGLAFASALMLYRPYFIVLTFISLGTAFYFTYRPQKDCAPDSIVWDMVAVYQPGKLWQQAPPEVSYSGGPVVDVIDETRNAIKRELESVKQ
jgi:hypothetical protein